MTREVILDRFVAETGKNCEEGYGTLCIVIARLDRATQ